MTGWICPACCWYDDDTDTCKKSRDFNDEDGKVGRVVECAFYVLIESEATT